MPHYFFTHKNEKEPDKVNGGYTDTDLVSFFETMDPKTFDAIYHRFSEPLFQYVYKRVKAWDVSEEIVQEIFVTLWNKREAVKIRTSLDAYLFGVAKFKILTYIRSERVRKAYASSFTSFTSEVDNATEDMMNLKDLQACLERSISELPGKCRTAFRLSRIEHEPIARIAQNMRISKRTVENYLSQAMKHLRTSLGEFLTLLVLWIIVV